MRGSFIFGITLKWYHETERNFKNVQSDKVCGGRDISRVAIQRKTGIATVADWGRSSATTATILKWLLIDHSPLRGLVQQGRYKQRPAG